MLLMMMLVASTLFPPILLNFFLLSCSCFKYITVANSYNNYRCHSNSLFSNTRKSYFNKVLCLHSNNRRSLLLSAISIFEEEVNNIIEPAAKSSLDSIQYSLLDVPKTISTQPLSTSYLKISPEGGRNDKKDLPLLLLHGFDSSLLEFRRFARLAAKATRRDVFVPDILGWGFINCSTVADVSPQAKLEHLKCFIQQIVGGPCVVVGASLGGAIAINLATEVCPELVDKVILLDAQGFIDGKGPSSLPDLFAKFGVAVLKSKPLRMFANYIAYHDKSLATLDAMHIGRLHCLTDSWDDCSVRFVQSGGFSVSQKVPLVKQPTLVIWGRNDEILEVSYADRFQREIAQCKVQIVENCGHVPHLEKPAETVAAIQSFLSNEFDK